MDWSPLKNTRRLGWRLGENLNDVKTIPLKCTFGHAFLIFVFRNVCLGLSTLELRVQDLVFKGFEGLRGLDLWCAFNIRFRDS